MVRWFRRHPMASLVGALALAAACIGAAVAYGGTREPDSDWDPAATPRTSTPATTSTQDSEFACLPEEMVERFEEQLKQLGPEHGLCDLSPRDAEAALLDEALEKGGGSGEACPWVVGTDEHPDLKISLPCAPGAEIIEYAAVPAAGGEVCMDLTYVPHVGAQQRTERLCPGDRASVGGTALGEDLALVG